MKTYLILIVGLLFVVACGDSDDDCVTIGDNTTIEGDVDTSGCNDSSSEAGVNGNADATNEVIDEEAPKIH